MSERDTFDDGASTSAPFPFCYEHQFAKPCPKCYAVKRTPGLDALERAVLAACVEEDKALSVDTSYTPTSDLDAVCRRIDNAAEARIAAVSRYRALLEGKEENNG